jgi:hypothetical protein
LGIFPHEIEGKKNFFTLGLGPIFGLKNAVGKSLIPPISSKRTIIFHLKSLSTKKTKTYDVGNPGPVLPLDRQIMWRG